jgi:hypothetical protein
MGLAVKRVGLAILCVLALGKLAHAQDLKDRFNIKLSLQGMYEAEQEGGVPQRSAQVSSPFELGYADLRAVVDARRLPGQFELHLDGRVRVTGEFSTDAATTGADQIIARGYFGGREYELRQGYVRRRGENWDFAFGRMIVNEADALKIDGARLWWRMHKHWEASLYAGGYPNPYSRSLTTDYNGNTSSLAFAGGIDAKYTYDKIWGSFSANGSYLGGSDDGGPLDPNLFMNGGGPVTPHTETPRVWLTWTDYVRLISWLDIFTDVVFDATGAAGAQLTRLDALASIRAGKHFTIHLGYDHLSAFAIEMWLTKLLASRPDHLANTIENNLIVSRTARDEARGDVDLHFGKASFYAEGRFRRRAEVNLGQDPQFVSQGNYVLPGLAYDATVGLRDRGTLWALRFGLWGMYLSDYQARSILAGIELGRSFFDDRLSVDLAFLYAKTNDNGAVNPLPACTPNNIPTTFQTCYGTRDAAEYETGITMTGVLGAHWLALLDYRLVYDQTTGNFPLASGQPMAGSTPTPPWPSVLTHVLLLRIEARY